MKLKIWEVKDKELPYRVELNSIKGAGKTLSSALMRVLHLAGIIGDEIIKLKDNEAKKKTARILFWKFDGGKNWVKAISALEKGE